MEQTAQVFKGLKPHILHGNSKYDKNHHTLISTLQTAYRRDINPDVIIIDEIHYGYSGKMIKELINNRDEIQIIGLSATPYDESGNLLDGFDVILNKYDIKYMIHNGYLVPIRSFILTKPDLSNVNIIAGDYDVNELGRIVCDNNTIMEIVSSTKEFIEKSKKTIIFAVDINHAELLSQAYKHAGFTTTALHSKLSKDDIKFEIDRFKKGYTKVLVSVLMLTTGFDVPETDVAVIARPTRSQNLYKQMVGRIARLAVNKKYGILLDCGNVIESLGKPLDPIKPIVGNQIENKLKCDICKSENLKLKKTKDTLFWMCKDCSFKKEIENKNLYICEYCNKKHTYESNFDLVNNKLYLNCECGYETLVSEFSGQEEFVEIDILKSNNSVINNILLSYEVKMTEYFGENILEDEKRLLEAQELKKEIEKDIKTYENANLLMLINQFHKNIFEEHTLIYLIKSLNIKTIQKINSNLSAIRLVDIKYLTIKLSISDLLSKKVWENIESEIYSINTIFENYKSFFELYMPLYLIILNDVLTINDLKKDFKFEDLISNELKNKISKEQAYIDFVYKLIGLKIDLFIGILEFKDARSFVMNLNLKSKEEWNEYRKRNDYPSFLPKNPYSYYSQTGWKNINDWLGIKQNDTNLNCKYLSYAEAKEFVSYLNLRSRKMWNKYCSNNIKGYKEKPDNIPENPNEIYKNIGWTNWNDWLDFYNRHVTYKESQKYVQTLGIKSRRQWQEYYRNNKIPNDIPIDPVSIYRNSGWENFKEWLGVQEEIDSNEKNNYYTFEEARSYVHSLNLNSIKEWKDYCNGLIPELGEIPSFIPKNPKEVYKKKGWWGLYDWIG